MATLTLLTAHSLTYLYYMVECCVQQIWSLPWPSPAILLIPHVHCDLHQVNITYP